MNGWIKGLRILIEEANDWGLWYARFFRGDQEITPETEIVEAVEKAVSFDEKGRPVVVLGQLPHSLQLVFPSHTWTWEGGLLARVPVRMGD